MPYLPIDIFTKLVIICNMTYKAFKYRFYPTQEQEQNLVHTFGCVRYVYNRSLRYRTDQYYQHQNSIGYNQNIVLLPQWKKDPETQWLNDVSSVPLQYTVRNLQTEFKNFFQCKAKYPQFKSKHSNQSATYASNAFQYDAKTKTLKLAKHSEVLNIVWSRDFEGTPSTVTVSKTPSGKFYISVLVDVVTQQLPKTDKVIGIDVGIKHIVVTSDGVKVGNPKNTAKHAKRLAKYQRRMCKKQKGSKNHVKAKLKVAKVYEDICNRRKDFTHKLTTKLIKENQTICLETLLVKNMVKNPKLAKSISDANWGEFVRQLEYKAGWYGRTIVKIDKWYPSSKRCNCCGYILKELTLDIREWECPECHVVHDRDVNAALNIRAAGLAVIACGETGAGYSSDTITKLVSEKQESQSVKIGIPAL